MQLKISLKKSLNEMASDYFDKSKKAKSKIERVHAALELTRGKLQDLAKKRILQQKSQKKITRKRSLEWFEKFRWFYTSGNFLVICGRDASQNETVVKKYMEPHDLYFHAEIQGAPHCILKSENRTVDELSKKEAAEFAGLYSKAWQLGQLHVDVYSVKPDQVSKQAPSGESMGKGAFMIYGQREWYKKTPVQCTLGVQPMNELYHVIAGPHSAIQAHATVWIQTVPGKTKQGALAKQIKKALDEHFKMDVPIPLDEIIRMLPAGNSDLLKRRPNK